MATESTIATSTSPVSRPLAHCPFPENLRVDLGSAEAEVLKSLAAPNGPVPVFSTRALEHGLNASGAAGLRQGFSWNSQMDLVWALGYPQMAFIVDGLEAETKDEIFAFYGRTLPELEEAYWFNLTESVYESFIPRRAAFALLYEVEHDDHPFALSDDEFREATEPRELSLEDVRALLLKVDTPRWLPRVALLLEALAGSSAVATVLSELNEAHTSDEETSKEFRRRIHDLFMALCRRLPADELAAVRARGAPDARARGMSDIAKGWIDSAIHEFQWADDVEEDSVRSFIESAKDGVGDVPFPRYLFAGGEKLIELQVSLFEKYMDGPRYFFSQYSTVRHPLLVGPALRTRAKQKYREGMTLWFQKHADYLRPVLENLLKDPELGKLASDVLKKLP